MYCNCIISVDGPLGYKFHDDINEVRITGYRLGMYKSAAKVCYNIICGYQSPLMWISDICSVGLTTHKCATKSKER